MSNHLRQISLCNKRSQGLSLGFFLLSLSRVLAKRIQGAGAAHRCACGAGVSSELHDAVAEITPQLHREQSIHKPFYLDGILERFRIHSKSSANADAMGVCNGSTLVIEITEE